MTTQAVAAPHIPAASDEARSHRLLGLSGIIFVPLFLVGWFASGGVTPHYGAADQDWVKWAHDNQWNGRISAFAMLLAAFVFLYFMSGIRAVFASAESRSRGSARLGRVAFAGALIGVGAMAMALVTMAAGSSDGAKVDPAVAKSVTTGAAGPFMVAAMGVRGIPDGRRARDTANGGLRSLDGNRRGRRGSLVPDDVPGHPRWDD